MELKCRLLRVLKLFKTSALSRYTVIGKLDKVDLLTTSILPTNALTTTTILKAGNSSKFIKEPGTTEGIIARHRQANESRNLYIKESRGQKAKLARAAGIDITGWEKYWEALDEWEALVAGVLSKETFTSLVSPPLLPLLVF